MTDHLVTRVPEAVHRLLGQMLAECVARSVQGEASVETNRTLTLYENTAEVNAELTINLVLKVSDRNNE